MTIPDAESFNALWESDGRQLIPRAIRRVILPKGLERKTDTRQHYADWLKGYRWDYFMTTTFRQQRQEPYYAIKGVYKELKEHNVARAFLVAEPHQSGDLHIHGVLAGTMGKGSYYGVPDNNIDTAPHIWHGLFERFGRSQVGDCRSNEAVSGYCSKYILKQQSRVCDYYEIFGNKYNWINGKI